MTTSMKTLGWVACLAIVMIVAAGCRIPITKTPDRVDPGDTAPPERSSANFIQGEGNTALHYVGDLMVVVRDFPAPMYAGLPGGREPHGTAHAAAELEKLLGRKVDVSLTVGGYLKFSGTAEEHNKVKAMIAKRRASGVRLSAPADADRLPMDGGRFMTENVFTDWDESWPHWHPHMGLDHSFHGKQGGHHK